MLGTASSLCAAAMKITLPSRFTALLALTATALLAASSLTHAGVQDKTPVPPMKPVDDSSIYHVLFQNQFSNYYITPRGLVVQDEGLVYQPLLLLFADLYKGDGWLNNIKLTLGCWNSVHTKADPVKTTTPYWNEFDLIAGLSTTVFKDWTFSATYLLFVSPNDAYEAPSNLELQASYSDHFLENLTPSVGKFTINPYAKLFIELNQKATVSTTHSSYNFECGFVPKYVFNFYPVSLEAPTFITFPGNGFYSQNGDPGLITTGGKLTVPLTFIPKKYGSWSVYGGVQYYHLYNDGIVLGNSFLPAGNTNRDLVQWYGGISLFF